MWIPRLISKFQITNCLTCMICWVSNTPNWKNSHVLNVHLSLKIVVGGKNLRKVCPSHSCLMLLQTARLITALLNHGGRIAHLSLLFHMSLSCFLSTASFLNWQGRRKRAEESPRQERKQSKWVGNAFKNSMLLRTQTHTQTHKHKQLKLPGSCPHWLRAPPLGRRKRQRSIKSPTQETDPEDSSQSPCDTFKPNFF